MQLQYDRVNNALRLIRDELGSDVVEQLNFDGMVDVAAGGRLVGIELRSADGLHSLEHRLRPWLEDETSGEFVSLEGDSIAYIELTVGDPADEARSCDVTLRTDLDAHGQLVAIAIPRRGAGYEISYPSGNR